MNIIFYPPNQKSDSTNQHGKTEVTGMVAHRTFKFIKRYLTII